MLQLPGGVDGGKPAFFEACALHHNGEDGKAASTTAAASTAGASGRGGLDISNVGFEQLDFSADVDVTVGAEDGGVRGGVSGGQGRPEIGGSPAVVIGKLRRVSNVSYARPFGRALEEMKGR